MLLAACLREVEIRRFQLAKLFEMLQKTCSDNIPQDAMICISVFTLVWRNCGGCDMMTLNFLLPEKCDTPYAYCREEVAYVRSLHSLIRSFKAGKMRNEDQSPSLDWVILDHKIHLLARCELFDRDKTSACACE